jgi:hypothetical protein
MSPMEVDPPSEGQVVSSEVVSRRAPAWTLVTIGVLLMAVAGLAWVAARPQNGPEDESAEPALPADSSSTRSQVETVDASRRARLRLTALDDDAAIFDLSLPTGGRLRVSVPSAFADDFTSASVDPDLTEVTLLGPGRATMTTQFDDCPPVPGLGLNNLGSEVARTETGVLICRPDEKLSTTVTTDVDLDRRDLESFDVRPMYMGPRRELAGNSASPLFGCSACGLGPLAYNRNGVIINRTGGSTITAVDDVFLDEVWKIEFSGDDPRIYADPTHLYVDVGTGPFVKLDPGTGQELWRIERQPGEEASGLGGDPVSRLRLLASSFRSEGDQREPTLRSIDAVSGDVAWISRGRSGANWQSGPPAIIDDIAVLVDVLDPEATDARDQPGSTARAYDLDSGRLRWEAPLDAPAGAFAGSPSVTAVSALDTSFLLVQTVNNHVYRLDPASGNVVWRTVVPNPTIIGVTVLSDGSIAIKMDTPAGTELFDPETGQRLSDSPMALPPEDCEAIYGGSPSVTLFSEEPPVGCLVVADFQNLQIWNKGTKFITLRWINSHGQIPPDHFASTGPIGNFLPFGPTDIESSPYAVPTLWLLGYERSPTGVLRPGPGSYGPIEVGMSIEEAARALGHDIAVDPDLGPGCAVVVGDPYSPLMSISVGAESSPLIVGLVDPRPGGAQIGRNAGC